MHCSLTIIRLLQTSCRSHADADLHAFGCSGCSIALTAAPAAFRCPAGEPLSPESPNFWRLAFRLRPEACPEFLLPLAPALLTAGKTCVLLRSAGAGAGADGRPSQLAAAPAQQAADVAGCCQLLLRRALLAQLLATGSSKGSEVRGSGEDAALAGSRSQPLAERLAAVAVATSLPSALPEVGSRSSVGPEAVLPQQLRPPQQQHQPAEPRSMGPPELQRWCLPQLDDPQIDWLPLPLLLPARHPSAAGVWPATKGHI